MSKMFDLQKCAVMIEKTLATYLQNEIDEANLRLGTATADELAMTSACMLMARTIGRIHVDSGESLTSVKTRSQECVDHHVSVLMKKYVELLNNKPGGLK